MQASIIIPAYREHETIGQTLMCLIESVRKTAWVVEIIVVDSSDDNRTTDAVLALKSQTDVPVSLLRPGRKTFAGKARNLGVAASRYALIVFLDAGVYAEPDWFLALARPFEQSASVDLVWGRSEYRPKTIWERSYIRSFYKQGYTRRYIRSAMMKKEVFIELGGFIEHVHAGEDLDFYARVRESSCREVFADDAVSLYSHFPQNTCQILKKWISFTRDNVLAGQAGKKQAFVIAEWLLLLLCVCLCLFVGWPWGLGVFLLLAAARFLFQIRRAGIRMQHGLEIPLTLYLIALFDAARWMGVMCGWTGKWTRRPSV